MRERWVNKPTDEEGKEFRRRDANKRRTDADEFCHERARFGGTQLETP
jgi:hypothetical protein